MTSQELLARVEQQAIRIHELETENARLRSLVGELPGRIKRTMLEGMAKAAVNCGASYGCSLATRQLEYEADESESQAE